MKVGDKFVIEIAETFGENSYKIKGLNSVYSKDTMDKLEPFDETTAIRSESFTDNEKIIFLSAIEEERRICKLVDEQLSYKDLFTKACKAIDETTDEQFIYEPRQASLTKVCDEIVRKVKGSLWT